METPKEYADNLRENVITKEMLGQCLYSVNKRAKNSRDKEREYKRYRSEYSYQNAMEYRARKLGYYVQKDLMLSILEPDEIHKECTERGVNYYLVYHVAGYLFHSPISENLLEEYKNLPITEIKELRTYGTCIENLISTQFVDKLCNVIRKGNYTLV